ncbi:nickel/cobalt transporter [Kitasatospora sp. NPDC003701]
MLLPRFLIRTGTGVAGALCLLGLAAPAEAHPLGNFSLNHYLGFTVRPDGIEVLAVTDAAEIPTLQEQPQVDRNGDGTADDAERASWAAEQCSRTAQRLQVTADRSAPVRWNTRSAQFRYEDGSAGLRTGRLQCVLDSALRVPPGGTTVLVASGSDPGRVGWNEITARGEGTTLDPSDVPARSVSDELRDYPRDLLNSPSGVTRAQFRVLPGGAAVSAAGTGDPGGAARGPTAWLVGLDSRLADLGAARHLTLPVGLLAVLLSVVLGAGHALLPGHGKTVMAAYLAGRRGRTRDAVTVGATVTLTHTAGVLVIGLCLTAFSSLAGDVLLGWLGVVSGALVALVGAALLRDAVRRAGGGPGPAAARGHAQEVAVPPRQRARAAVAAVPALRHDHAHPHPHGPHDHDHDHDHAHPHPHGSHDDHPHPHRHDEHEHHHHDHGGGSAARHHGQEHEHTHRHGLFGGHHHHHPAPGRRGLIGLGIAGGLVPSPSALVVLLGAIALGRTLFGAALVVAYGLGMAATLTAVGLLLVRLGDRIAGAADGAVIGRLRRLAPHTALLTALLILGVGVGLVVRSLPSTL